MTTPQDFDIDAWLEDAERPARSVTVYQKAGLIADLDALEEKIRNADDDEVDGPSMGGGVGALRSKYADLARKFHESGLTIRIEGRDETERMRVAAGIEDPSMRIAAVIADAITSPKFTPEQIVKLQAKIGDAQWELLVTRVNEACKEVPTVSADFLPKRSTPDDGGE